MCSGLLLFCSVLIELPMYLRPNRICSLIGTLELKECLFNLNSVELFILQGLEFNLVLQKAFLFIKVELGVTSPF